MRKKLEKERMREKKSERHRERGQIERPRER